MLHLLSRPSLSLPLILSVAATTGCIPLASSDDRDEDSRSGFHDVTINWRLKNVDGSLMSACPPGFTTILAGLYRSPGALVPPPDTVITRPCTPEGSLTAPVATAGELKDTSPENLGGYYDYSPQKDIYLAVTEETQSAFAAVTSIYYVEALTADLTLDFDLYPDGGRGALAWQLESSLTGAPLASCASAGVDQIEAAARPFYDDTAPYVAIGAWGCQDVDPYQYLEPNGNGFPLLDEQYELGTGVTGALAPGDYKVELRAKRAGAVVGTGEADLTIESQNDVNPIRPAIIPVSDR